VLIAKIGSNQAAERRVFVIEKTCTQIEAVQYRRGQIANDIKVVSRKYAFETIERLCAPQV